MLAGCVSNSEGHKVRSKHTRQDFALYSGNFRVNLGFLYYMGGSLLTGVNRHGNDEHQQ